jgi:predicted RND superfamily exporter protein
MAVTFHLEPLIEEQLRRDLTDLNGAAKEALLVSLYRQGKLSHRELSQELSLDRFATQAVLKKHNVTEDLPTPEQLEADRQTLEMAPPPPLVSVCWEGDVASADPTYKVSMKRLIALIPSAITLVVVGSALMYLFLRVFHWHFLLSDVLAYSLGALVASPVYWLRIKLLGVKQDDRN